MSNTIRYEKLIMAALEAQQLKIEYKRKLREIAENITASELNGRIFDDGDAERAIYGGVIHAENGVEIEEKQYVGSALIYKQVELHMHTNRGDLKGDAIKQILSEIGTSDILKA